MKKMSIATLLVLSTLVTLNALAQGKFPERPITMVVAIAAGGGADLAARVAANSLSKVYGLPVPVENRPGGNNRIGWHAVKNSLPNGYTILSGSATMVNGSMLDPDPSLDMEKDFTPIGFTNRYDLVLVTSSSSGYKMLRELIDVMRKNPEKVSYGTTGEGTPTTLAGAYLASLSGKTILDVSYKGTAPSLQDIVAGRLTYIFTGISTSSGLMKSGNLVGLAVASPRRHPLIPNVPTMAEAGLPEYMSVDWRPWTGIFVASGVPRSIQERLNSGLNQALKDPELQKRYADGAAEAAEPLTLEQAAAKYRAEFPAWRSALKSMGLLQ